MFGKRKGPEGDGGEGSGFGEQREAQPGAARSSSRPDPAAVLERQPTPPVRRPADYGGGRRKAEAKSDDNDGKKLTVGRGIKLSGEITACEKLVVEGEVQADLFGAQVLEIAEHGLFKGRAIVDHAEISGVFDGDLTVRDRLLLRASGRIDGVLKYAEMEIERGGRVRGTIAELEPPASLPLEDFAGRSEPAAPETSPEPDAAPADTQPVVQEQTG